MQMLSFKKKIKNEIFFHLKMPELDNDSMVKYWINLFTVKSLL